MKNSFVFAIVSALVGYTLGWSWPVSAPEGVAELKSEAPLTAVNDYKNLPCPSEAEYRDLAGQVNLIIPAGPSLDEKCDDSTRALLGKSLRLMKHLKFKFPESWPEKLKSNLADSFIFLKERSSKLTLDLTQKDSVAYNKVQDKEIYLGGRFFTYEPLLGVAILVHEARHSEPQAMSHTYCEGGDLPWGPGACDAVFYKNDEEAGAYAYGTLFNIGLALYAEGLAISDREYAMADALTELGNRFNVMPPTFARRVDVLAILDEKSDIHLVHPFLGYTKKVSLKFGDVSEKPERIEFATTHGGLLIFTNKKNAWLWNPTVGLKRFLPKVVPANYTIDDIARVQIPFGGGQPLFYVRHNQELRYVDYQPEKNESVLMDYPLHRGSNKALPQSPFYRTFLAFMNRTVHLTEDGSLYFAPEYGDEPAFGQIEALSSPNGWIYGTGGVIYNALWLIDRRGDLKYASYELIPDQYGYEAKEYRVADSGLKATRPLKKFFQGVSVSVALDDEGQLQAWRYGSPEPKVLSLPKVKDFVLMRRPELSRAFGQTYADRKSFVETCRITKTVDDPWLGRGMGYDAQGKFIVAGASEDSICVEMPEVDVKKTTPYYSIQK